MFVKMLTDFSLIVVIYCNQFSICKQAEINFNKKLFRIRLSAEVICV